MDKKENLNKMYDGKKIEEIETEITGKHDLLIETQKDMIFALSSLKMTNRYKENPLYRESSFKEYLLGMFNMRENNFYEMERAFIQFPKEARLYGVGLVAKVRRKCGAKKERAVFAEIAIMQGTLKTPIKREKIESIIEKHAIATR